MCKVEYIWHDILVSRHLWYLLWAENISLEHTANIKMYVYINAASTYVLHSNEQIPNDSQKATQLTLP